LEDAEDNAHTNLEFHSFMKKRIPSLFSHIVVDQEIMHRKLGHADIIGEDGLPTARTNGNLDISIAHAQQC